MNHYGLLPLLVFCALFSFLVTEYSGVAQSDVIISVCRVEGTGGQPPLEVIWMPIEIYRHRGENKNHFWVTPKAAANDKNSSCWQLPAPFAFGWLWKRMFDAQYGDLGPKLLAEFDPPAIILAVRSVPSATATGLAFQVDNISTGMLLKNGAATDLDVQSALFKRLGNDEKNLRLPVAFTVSKGLQAPPLRPLNVQMTAQSAWVQVSTSHLEFQSQLVGGASVTAACQLEDFLLCEPLQTMRSTTAAFDESDRAFQDNCASLFKFKNLSHLAESGMNACIFDRVASLVQSCPSGDPERLRKLLDTIQMPRSTALPVGLIKACVLCLSRPEMPRIAHLWADAFRTEMEFQNPFHVH